MFPPLNEKLQDDDARQTLRGLLADGLSLVEILDHGELGLGISGPQLDFIATTPSSIQAAVLAVVEENLSRDEPKQMMFSWSAEYDWEMRLRESMSSTISDGGITMQIGSRYPDDPHPGTG